MREADVRVWLFEKGFEPRKWKPNEFVASHQDSSILVRISSGGCEVSVSLGAAAATIGAARLDELHIDRHGMLLGVGLRDAFLDGTLAANELPTWFADCYSHGVLDTLSDEATDTLGDKVAVWATSRGFKEVGPGILEAPYDGCSVQLRLDASEIWTTVFFADGREMKSNSDLHGVCIDKDGMLRGADLSAYFIDQIAGGGEVPVWFPQKFARKYAGRNAVAMGA